MVKKIRKVKEVRGLWVYILICTAIAFAVLLPLIINALALSDSEVIEIEDFPEFVLNEEVAADGSVRSENWEDYVPVSAVEVEAGTAVEELVLPENVKALVRIPVAAESGEVAEDVDAAEGLSEESQPQVVLEEVELPGEWICEEYNSNEAGTYQFTLSLPDNYSYQGVLPYVLVVLEEVEEMEQDSELPEEGNTEVVEEEMLVQESEVEDNVESDSKEIVSMSANYPGYPTFLIKIVKGQTDIGLPTSIGVQLKGEIYTNIPISWNGSIDVNTPGIYRMDMQIEGGYIWNGHQAYAEVVVEEKPYE